VHSLSALLIFILTANKLYSYRIVLINAPCLVTLVTCQTMVNLLRDNFVTSRARKT